MEKTGRNEGKHFRRTEDGYTAGVGKHHWEGRTMKMDTATTDWDGEEQQKWYAVVKDERANLRQCLFFSVALSSSPPITSPHSQTLSKIIIAWGLLNNKDLGKTSKQPVKGLETPP
jgi:hypothetical protein